MDRIYCETFKAWIGITTCIKRQRKQRMIWPGHWADRTTFTGRLSIGCQHCKKATLIRKEKAS